MGINQSIEAVAGGAVIGSTTNWKSYQIQRVITSQNSIKFFLDDNVKYSNEYTNIVNCDNTYPYYNIHAGDLVEANWYRTEDYNSSHEFIGSDNLRTIRFQKRLCDYAVALPNRNNRDLFRGINGTFIIERKVEWQGDIKVEYIEMVTVSDNQITYSIETRYMSPTY